MIQKLQISDSLVPLALSQKNRASPLASEWISFCLPSHFCSRPSYCHSRQTCSWLVNSKPAAIINFLLLMMLMCFFFFLYLGLIKGVIWCVKHCAGDRRITMRRNDLLISQFLCSAVQWIYPNLRFKTWLIIKDLDKLKRVGRGLKTIMTY